MCLRLIDKTTPIIIKIHTRKIGNGLRARIFSTGLSLSHDRRTTQTRVSIDTLSKTWDNNILILRRLYLSIIIIHSGLSEEEATQLILYWQARQLSIRRARLGLPGRYTIDNNIPGPWPRLAYDRQSTSPPLPEPPLMPPPLFVFQGE